jgi:ribosome-associated protein
MAKAQAPSSDRVTRRKTTSGLPKALVAAVAAVQDKKATDVIVLDLRAADGFTDFFLICTGQNARQIATIVDAVQERLREDFGERPAMAEGMKKSEWLLLDYFNFVVHVFSPQCRAYYGLERLWGNAERHEFAEPHSSLT